MIPFIAGRIELARETSLEAGLAKYRAYFVRTRIYKKWRADVDSMLIQDGYEDCVSDE